MANLYYREALDEAAFFEGAVIEVDGEEARHAVRVSRMRAGERTMVGNGAGVIGSGEVVSVDRARFCVRLDTISVSPAPVRALVLVQALAKGDRDERAVEQATEFGVDVVMPWQAARSVSRWDGADGEKTAKGMTKWQRVAREASKQSLRARIPAVTGPATVQSMCSAAQQGTPVIALHPSGERALSEFSRTDLVRAFAEGPSDRGSAQPDGHQIGAYLLVGPEGGFAPEELDSLDRAGAHVLTLGETVLRTSSAGPAALAVVNAALGRW